MAGDVIDVFDPTAPCEACGHDLSAHCGPGGRCTVIWVPMDDRGRACPCLDYTSGIDPRDLRFNLAEEEKDG